MARKFDRSAEDVGNILRTGTSESDRAGSGHCGAVLRLRPRLHARPYVDFGVFNFNNMWVNVGDQQFHLPQGKAQRFRGTIGLVVPDLEQLRWRLDQVGRSLKDTEFGWEVYDDYIGVTCPWGNRCAATRRTTRCRSAFAISTWTYPREPAHGIARFYRDVFATPATDANGMAEVQMGTNQIAAIRRERQRRRRYDGHHIAIYVANFSAAHDWLEARTNSSPKNRTSTSTGFRRSSTRSAATAALVELEHEVRSMKHPMWGRRLTNRNSGQTFVTFHRGREAFVP